MKPLIGITCSWAPDKPGREELPDPAFDYLKSQYSEKIARFGGVPVILPNLPDVDENPQLIAEIVAHLDGIVFSGGRDIDPRLFGDERKHTKTQYDPQRDRRRDIFELALARYAIHNTKIPILGICRGHQLLNVALGGTLWQDLSQYWATKPPVIQEHRSRKNPDGTRSRSWHRVKISPETLLYKIIGAETITVNSSHHQAVKDVGRNLVVSATSPDGLPEALELNTPDRFLLTVQWHPEAMDDESSAKLFRAFISVAEKN